MMVVIEVENGMASISEVVSQLPAAMIVGFPGLPEELEIMPAVVFG